MNAKITSIASRVESLIKNEENTFYDNADYLQALEILTAARLHLTARRLGHVETVKQENPTEEEPSDCFERFQNMDRVELLEVIAKLESEHAPKVQQYLSRGEPLFFEQLCHTYQLDVFERQVVLLLFFFSTSPRTKRLMSRLNIISSTSNSNITVGTILDLFSNGFAEQLQNRRYFGRTSTLVGQNLLTAQYFDMDQDQLIEQRIKIHPRMINFILGDETLYDTDPTGIEVLKPVIDLDLIVMPDGVVDGLLSAAKSFINRMSSNLGRSIIWRMGYGTGLAMLFHGPSGTGKTMLAHVLAASLEIPLVSLDLKAEEYTRSFSDKLEKVFREARLNGGIVFIDECDDLFEEHSRGSRSLLIELERSQCLTILSTNQDVRLDPALERRIALKIALDLPNTDLRRRIWEKLIPPDCILHKDVNLDEIAESYIFTGGLIKNAVLMAVDKSLLSDPSNKNPLITHDQLREACERQVKSLIEGFEFGKVVMPADISTAPQLRLSDSARLTHLSSCLTHAAGSGERLVAVVACRCLETGLAAVRSALSIGGLASREFTFGEAVNGPPGNNIVDPLTHQEIEPLKFIFRKRTGMHGAVVLIDNMGDMSQDFKDYSEADQDVVTILNCAKSSDYPVIILTRDLGCWGRHPYLDHCIHILPPSEENQFALWHKLCPQLQNSEELILDTVGQQTLHGFEIAETIRKSRVVSWIETGSADNAPGFITTVLARERRGMPVLFGKDI